MAPDAQRKIDIARPSVGEEEWQALREPIESGWLTQGPKVRQFEEAFAERHQVKHAIATTSCTTALHLALVSLGVGPGDEVIVPAFTWVATANVVVHCGATPVFVDVDPVTFNINPELIAEKITPHTKVIMPVHLFGLCADMDEISDIAGDIPLVEDAACAAGAAYKGRPAGSLGSFGAFSFHPRKVITTGEGGMLTTSDDALAEKAIMLRNHGASIPEEVRHHGPQPWLLPEFNEPGFNYRMTDLQGAVGVVQIGKLDELIDQRNQMATFYERELSSIEWLRTPTVPDGWTHGWQSYVCQVDESSAPMSRNNLMEYLEERGISTRPGTHAVHGLGHYKQLLGCHDEDFPTALRCERQTIAIPLHNRMTMNDSQRVVDVLTAIA